MIILKSFKNERVRHRFHGIETRVLRNMGPDELVAELQRVERDIRKWQTMVSSQPRWFQAVSAVRAEKNCLYSEKRRIERELKARVEQMTKVTSVMGAVGWTDVLLSERSTVSSEQSAEVAEC